MKMVSQYMVSALLMKISMMPMVIIINVKLMVAHVILGTVAPILIQLRVSQVCQILPNLLMMVTISLDQ
jgi:hypothetical protein